MTGFRRETDVLFLLHSLHASSSCPCRCVQLQWPPPLWQAPRPTIGRTLTPQVKDFGLCRKAAALTSLMCVHCRTLLCKFLLMPGSFFSGKKLVLAITQAHSAHLEKAALLERLTLFFDFLASPPAPQCPSLLSEFMLPLLCSPPRYNSSPPDFLRTGSVRSGAAAVDR